VHRTLTDSAEMRTALAAVLTDPAFVRSPALARLAEYLVEATISGQGKSLKSYSVAVDGLGKSPDYDPQADSYARVVVARLRKALDAYYAGAGARHAQRLWIESGSYEVLLVPNSSAAGAPPAPVRSKGGSLHRRLIWAGLAAALVLAAALFILWRTNTQAAETLRWRTSNFPFVDVSVRDESTGGKATDLARQMRQSILANLDNYEGVRAAFNPSVNAEYAIEVAFRNNAQGSVESISVIDRKFNRIIWSDSGKMTFTDADSELSSDEFLARSIFQITHMSGIIHSNERRRNFAVDTPYGCWLQFSGMIQDSYSVSNNALTHCAEGWYAAAPNHPLAVALYGWTLTDKSIYRLTDSGRATSIADALAVLEKARAMNPGSPLLQVAAMRAYAFAGDGAAVRLAASQALALNPDNLDIQGAAGMMLALQNDPQGEVLLNKAIAAHFNPPPWYFVGAFIAAMMRDDPAGAQGSLARLRAFQHSLPIVPILAAAFEARAGHLERARAEWNSAAEKQPILRIRPDSFLSRLPMAPDVRARLEQWLAPVLGRKP